VKKLDGTRLGDKKSLNINRFFEKKNRLFKKKSFIFNKKIAYIPEEVSNC